VRIFTLCVFRDDLGLGSTFASRLTHCSSQKAIVENSSLFDRFGQEAKGGSAVFLLLCSSSCQVIVDASQVLRYSNGSQFRFCR